jgi:iron complex outermembrane receptor protein
MIPSSTATPARPTNLTNHFYVASCLTGLPYCGLGDARTVLGTLKYNWN